MENKYSSVGDPLFLANIDALSKAFPKISRNEIEKWLQSKSSYTLYRNRRKNFPTNYYRIKSIGELFEADLADVSNLANYNNKYKFLLLAIDVFSKYLYVIPLKNKTASETSAALEKVFKSFPYKISVLQTDSGKEFVNQSVKQVLKKYSCSHRQVLNPINKSAVVERCVRTLKNLLYRYMDEAHTRKYIDVLDKIVHTYNHRNHRTIQMSPHKLMTGSAAIQARVLKQYEKSWKLRDQKAKKSGLYNKLAIDDYVRIRKSQPTPFTKEHEPTFSREIFKIVHINKSLSYPLYLLIDLNGNPIKGQFYERELQKVQVDVKNDLFAIDKILRRKKGQVYVSWQGYGKDFNSWIPVSSLSSLRTVKG